MQHKVNAVPREDRRIIFDLSEAYQALFAFYTKREGKALMAGRLVKVEEDKADDKRLFFHVQSPDSNKPVKLEFGRDFLAAALLLYCKGCGIPIPKVGKKSVVLRDKDVILRVQR